MIFKTRTEPIEMTILGLLNNRMTLVEKDKQHYHNLVKGYGGEVMFDSLTEKLDGHHYILNDLLLESNNSKFQIDSLMISPEPLYLFEVKNYEGDFYFENGRFYTIAKKEIKNPLLQLERSESLLRQLLQDLGYRISIEAFVVFINPGFTLYQAPLNKPIIYPNQLPRFLKKISSRPSTLSTRHKSLAEQLVSLHQRDFPYDRLPSYDFDSLRKGMNCRLCHSFMVRVHGRYLVCEVCGHKEEIDNAILRAVDEMMLLLPAMKISTNRVRDWCQVVDSTKTIRRVMKQHYPTVGKKEFSFLYSK